MFKEHFFKTAVGEDWTPNKETRKSDSTIFKKIECDYCKKFIPINNVDIPGFMGLQLEGDLGLCVRQNPQVKVVTVGYYQQIRNCKVFSNQ